MRTLVAGKNKRYFAFSLLEVIIVLVILSVAFALAIPKIGSVSWGIKRSGAIRTISSAFHMASSIAAATGKPSKLIFNFEEGSMSVERQENPRSDETEEIEVITESIFKDVEKFMLPEDTVYNTFAYEGGDKENFEYRFFPNGEAAGYKLPVLLAGSYPLLIDVDRLTGKPIFVENEK